MKINHLEHSSKNGKIILIIFVYHPIYASFSRLFGFLCPIYAYFLGVFSLLAEGHER